LPQRGNIACLEQRPKSVSRRGLAAARCIDAIDPFIERQGIAGVGGFAGGTSFAQVRAGTRAPDMNVGAPMAHSGTHVANGAKVTFANQAEHCPQNSTPCFPTLNSLSALYRHNAHGSTVTATNSTEFRAQ
jgi:hypothetical protein